MARQTALPACEFVFRTRLDLWLVWNKGGLPKESWKDVAEELRVPLEAL